MTIGGEEVSRLTWAEYYAHRGRLQESLNINVGLYALQRCIECLIQRDKLKAEGKAVHVPFADSKLTLLLKDALMGGARTTVLVCASLEPRNAVEVTAAGLEPTDLRITPPNPPALRRFHCHPNRGSHVDAPPPTVHLVAALRRGLRPDRDAFQGVGRRRGDD